MKSEIVNIPNASFVSRMPVIELEIAKRIILAALEREEDKLRSAGETEAAYKYAGARMLIEELKA